MSYARSSGGAGAGDPSSGLGGSSLTCSSSICSLKSDLGEALKFSSDWTKKSIGRSRVTIGEICGSFGKRSKTDEVDREAQK